MVSASRSMWSRQVQVSMAEQLFAADPESTVGVQCSSGDVRIDGWDRPEVQVVSGDVSATVRQNDDTLQIVSRSHGPAELTVRVPDRCKLMVRTTSGDVRIDGVHNDTDVTTTSGDVALCAVGGIVRVHTTSGGIAVQTSSLTELAAETSSGDVAIIASSGEGVVRTKSGDVLVTEMGGGLEAHTLSGDVETRKSRLIRWQVTTVSGDSLLESALNPEGSYQVHSVSGDVRLQVPEEQAATLEYLLMSGDLRCELPHELISSKQRLQSAQINGGGVPFTIQSTSGDVRVSAATSVDGQTTGYQPRPLSEMATPWSESDREPFGLDENGGDTDPDEQLTSRKKRMAVLKAIEEGRMTVAEAVGRLREIV